MKQQVVRSALMLSALLTVSALRAAETPGLPAAAPAPAPPPAITPQAEVGREPFAANCGFCHGRDAMGGSSGPDLTHSELVNADKDGNLISDLLRTGRADKGMPAFANVAAKDVSAIVAFIHYQKTVADSAFGQRRSVDASDLSTGDAGKGKTYFEKLCSSCHSASGDMAGVGKRYTGLTLLRRLLYPGSESRIAVRKPPTVEVTTKEGQHLSGALLYRDEFTLAIRDQNGGYRSWPTTAITFTVTDPLEAHVEQLSRYTDADLHDVYAYLQGLK